MIKHSNAGKIDSHQWLFWGLYQHLDPKFIQFIDIGTIPKEHSILDLMLYMEINADTGGVCGEIEAMFEADENEGCISWVLSFILCLI